MALDTTTKIDVNRSTAGLSLTPELLDIFIQNVTQGSAVMQLARRVAIPGVGVKTNIVTGDPTPAWVTESTEKTVSKPSFTNKTMVPYTLAVIVPFSNQFRRDASALYDQVIARIPNALGRAFDATVFFGEAPGSNFDTLKDADAVAVDAGTYDATVGIMTSLAASDGSLTGFVLSPQGNGVYMTARNSEGALEFPGFAPGGSLLGVPTVTANHAYKEGSSAANTIGFAGDWSQAVVGIVEDVKLEYADQATLNDGTNNINLFQRNMFAVRAEMEVGFVVKDSSYFKRLTDTYSAEGASTVGYAVVGKAKAE